MIIGHHHQVPPGASYEYSRALCHYMMGGGGGAACTPACEQLVPLVSEEYLYVRDLEYCGSCPFFQLPRTASVSGAAILFLHLSSRICLFACFGFYLSVSPHPKKVFFVQHGC